MKTRLLFVLAAGLLVLAALSSAQPGRLYRVGFLSQGNFLPDTAVGSVADDLIVQLTRSGYTPGVTLEIVKRGAEGHIERLPGLAAELIAARVDLIVTFGYPAAAAAKQGTDTVPLVIFNAGDPVKTRLIASLNRPGGNVTGISDVAAELAPKRLQLLKEANPKLRRVAMLWNTKDIGMSTRYEGSAAAARAVGIAVQPLGVGEPDDFGNAFAMMERSMPDGLLMVADPLTFLNRKRVFDFASEHRLPAIYEAARFAHDGGLMAYGPEPSETAERGASLITRILKGAKPADLPFEQPTRFRLAINLKTARAQGIAIPQSLLLRADEVIQ